MSESRIKKWQDYAIEMLAPTPQAMHRLMQDEIDELRSALEGREDDLSADYHTIMRMGELLAGVAIALKGPEEARKRHGYQDLPKLVQALVFEVEMLKQQLAKSPLPEIVTLPVKILNADGMAEWADVCTEESSAAGISIIQLTQCENEISQLPRAENAS